MERSLYRQQVHAGDLLVRIRHSERSMVIADGAIHVGEVVLRVDQLFRVLAQGRHRQRFFQPRRGPRPVAGRLEDVPRFVRSMATASCRRTRDRPPDAAGNLQAST